MIPGPFTVLQLLRAAIHFMIGCYFFVRLLRQPGAGTKIFSAFCCLAMLVFAYDDWLYLRLNS